MARDHSILVAQGGGDMHAPDGSIHLVRLLERELGSEIPVIAPELPDADNPRYDPWREALERKLDGLDGKVFLVGHSLGGSILLKLLAEGRTRRSIGGVFLVSVPWWGPDGWDYEEFAVGDDFASKLPDAPVFLYQSVDDPEVPFAHLALYEARMPAATVRAIPGVEHSFTHGLPELVDDIRSVVTASGPRSRPG